MKKRVVASFDKIHHCTLVQATRRALVILIPVLLVGSFAELFISFPSQTYIDFITSWCNGIIYKIFNMLQGATFGMASVYMAAIVGYQFGAMNGKNNNEKKYGAMLVSVGCFFMLSGAVNGMNNTFGARGMLMAIFSGALAPWLYLFLEKHIKRKPLLADGSDENLRSSIHSIFPMAFSLLIISTGNNILLQIFQKESFYELTMSVITSLANHIGAGIAGAFTYIFSTNLLWFFGIHGSDAIEGISETLFKPAIDQNIARVLEGQAATEIITRPFFNTFVMIGGCGATLCLLISLLLFSKRKGTRSLTSISAIPMLFNINEIMVFGLPVIYNFYFLVPFLLVPFVCFGISYFAMYMGWVPLVVKEIQWTTPVLINGYLSTGSVRGLILQLVNLVAGVAIYTPFVKLYDKRKQELSQIDYDKIISLLKQSENSGKPIILTGDSQPFSGLAKTLAADLEYAYEHKELRLFYQPQYNDKDTCFGVEALMRWNHAGIGWVYPPLIFRLAEEIGIRAKLEKWVIRQAVEDAETLKERYPEKNIKVSINVTGAAIQDKEFEIFLEELAGQKDIKGLNICLEITEQDALLLDDVLRQRFFHLQELGYVLAVDDFSMGSTSIRYLTGNHFEMVKLDGSLVRGIMDNPRCYEIIASIVHLSETLGVKVMAEYVSNEKIRAKLLEVGCHLYQGWFFSPAIPLDEFEKEMDKIQK